MSHLSQRNVTTALIHWVGSRSAVHAAMELMLTSRDQPLARSVPPDTLVWMSDLVPCHVGMALTLRTETAGAQHALRANTVAKMQQHATYVLLVTVVRLLLTLRSRVEKASMQAMGIACARLATQGPTVWPISPSASRARQGMNVAIRRWARSCVDLVIIR